MQEKKITQKSILIVEDEKTLREILRDKLEISKFDVFEAKNGEEGLSISLEKHPDLILLDIIMPVMDGMTMLKKLREDEWGKNAQVLLLTNLTSAEKMTESIEQGVYHYLIKSDWKLHDLIKKIEDKLLK